jgi:site-specific DNA-methyltransferase (cytosine-N4-specific)
LVRQLRDYGWSGQWGMEKHFQEYLEHLWQLMDEAWRVLKDEGTVWINLGDTYSTQSGSMGSGRWVDPKNPKATNVSQQQPKTGLPNKSLCLIPHRFAIGLSDMGWIIRNDIKWIKRNAMPESVTDRFSKKSEYFFFIVKQEKYYFDLDAIRDKHLTTNNIRKLPRGTQSWASNAIKGNNPQQGHSGGVGKNENGKNPGDVSLFWDNSDEDNLEIDYWDIPTKPSNENHYASYNTKLISKPILAGCPKGGIILDPFCGTGTTGVLALDLRRRFIGIEGKEEYVKIANKNISLIKSQPSIDFDELIID